MMVRGMNPLLEEPVQESRLVQFLHENGFQALMVELAVLAIATFGAIGTDDYWNRRVKKQ